MCHEANNQAKDARVGHGRPIESYSGKLLEERKQAAGQHGLGVGSRMVYGGEMVSTNPRTLIDERIFLLRQEIDRLQTLSNLLPMSLTYEQEVAVREILLKSFVR